MFASAVRKLPLIFVYGQLRDTVIFRNRVKHEERGTKLEHVRRSPVPTNLIFIKMADFRKIGTLKHAIVMDMTITVCALFECKSWSFSNRLNESFLTKKALHIVVKFCCMFWNLLSSMGSSALCFDVRGQVWKP